MDARTDIPPPSSNVLDTRGRMTEVWWQFLLLLWRRTGGGEGGDLTKIIEDISDLMTAADSMAPDAYAASILSRLDSLQAAIAAQVAVMARSTSSGLSADPVLAPIPCQCTCGMGPVSTHGIQDDPDLHALATPERAGFMSAADKAKLDAL